MLGDKTAVATLAVKDMEAAKKFYNEILGLEMEQGNDPGGTMFKSGNSHVFVYESQYAGTNQATAASWGVGDDMEKIVDDLKSKGVSFEHYDLPDMKVEGDRPIMGDMKAVWFKDPDGNILNLVNQM
jgi:catechol 2,3-dioxygenase-like lactoylglutathione lyase family enzyme